MGHVSKAGGSGQCRCLTVPAQTREAIDKVFTQQTKQVRVLDPSDSSHIDMDMLSLHEFCLRLSLQPHNQHHFNPSTLTNKSPTQMLTPEL